MRKRQRASRARGEDKSKSRRPKPSASRSAKTRPRAAAEGWRETFDALPDLILLLDPNHRIVRANRAASRILGREPRELAGRLCFQCIHGGPAPIESCPHAQTIRDGQEHTAEVYEAHLGRYFLVTTTPLVGARGKIRGSVHVMRDITERKQVENTVRRALQDSRRRESEIQALLDAARSVLEYKEFKNAARAIFHACKSLLGAQAGYVAVLSADGKENELLFLDAGGLPCTVDPSLPMPVRGLREVAYRTGETVYENDFTHSRWNEFLPAGHVRLENVLFKPLVVEGRAIGLLGLANKPGGFTEHDAHLATAFGKLAAVALHNSRTLKSLEHSEERFRKVADSATDAIISIDSSGRVIFWNPAAEEIFGYRRDEMLGRSLETIIPERLRLEHRRGMDRIRAGAPPRILRKILETWARRQDGTEFPVELSVAGWETQEGIFFTGIVRDISDRKQAEAQLKQHQEHLEELVAARTAEIHAVIKELQAEIAERQRTEKKLRRSEASLAEAQRIAHLGNWDWNIVTNELSWSDEIYRIFGLAPQEFGATYEAFLNSVHPEDRPSVTRAVNAALYESQPYQIEHRIVRPGGEVRVVQERAEVTSDAAGKPVRMFGTVQDITERKQAEAARDQAERQLEEQRARAVYADRLRSLGEMAAGIAHELNQPLLGVRGLAEHLLIGAERGWDVSPEKIKEKVNLIVEQSDRMSHIIERVRMFARGADNQELMPVQVNEVIRSAAALLGAQTRARGMSLHCDLQENLPEVMANPFSLEEVVLNLISNARDATAERLKQNPAAVPPRIVLSSRLESTAGSPQVVLAVQDQGMGIPAEILNRVFDPFFTTKSPEKGTGLGLSISKSIVESFGGVIRIQSAPGSGTTVSVSLPARAPGGQEHAAAKERS